MKRLKFFAFFMFPISSAVILLSCWAAFSCYSRYVPLPVESFAVRDVSPALYDAEGRLFHMRLSGASEWFLPVPLAEMGEWLPRVAVGVEDRRFYRHGGVDVLALARAVWQNAAAFRVVSGASTITSQVIRLAITERTGRRRSLAAKALEFAQALKLERLMDKDKILETYLNLAPFGGNIRGAQAAALIYFGKPASKLSPGEACLLIGMLKGPSLYRPDRHPERARRRRDFIIGLLERRGAFTAREAALALLEDLPSNWISPPQRAFHFAEMVFDRLDSSADGGRIYTTLNLETQSKAEAILARVVSSFPPRITAAAGVVDNNSGALTAWVGNARFGAASPFGQTKAGQTAPQGIWVDCGRAPRSPGSALKPFAYLAAFEAGLLTPSSLLADTPLAFSGRAPRNFDLTYRGAVSVRVALSDSLNAPAVRVLRMAGQDSVLHLLRRFGFDNLTEPASHYGDSLVLGGCEVSVIQMLAAYAALANGGAFRDIALTKPAKLAGNAEPSPAVPLASAEAAWLVADVLDNRSALSAFARETLGGAWHVAVKTGTSYGLRDAWAAAWTPDFTVVVWVGDPSGEPWPGLVGAEAAAPAALSLLRVLSPRSRWYSPPDGLELREVCSLSGRPPTAACLLTRLDWSIKGVTQSVPCDLHVIRKGKNTVLWPAELAANAPLPVRKRPDISIASPIAGATYYLAPLASEQKIPLRAEGALGKVWWYLNGSYIGAALPHETFFYDIPDGRHTVSASDEEGRTASTKLTVVLPSGGARGVPLDL